MSAVRGLMAQRPVLDVYPPPARRLLRWGRCALAMYGQYRAAIERRRTVTRWWAEHMRYAGLSEVIR